MIGNSQVEEQSRLGFPDRNSPTPLVASSRSGKQEQGWNVFVVWNILNCLWHQVPAHSVAKFWSPGKKNMYPQLKTKIGSFLWFQNVWEPTKIPRRYLHGIPVQDCLAVLRNLSLNITMTSCYPEWGKTPPFLEVDPSHTKKIKAGSPVVGLLPRSYQVNAANTVGMTSWWFQPDRFSK